MDNDIKSFFCNGCHSMTKIIVWDKKHSRFGFLCYKCKKKIDKRLKQILNGF